jgi:hypothetical protein
MAGRRFARGGAFRTNSAEALTNLVLLERRLLSSDSAAAFLTARHCQMNPH